MDLTLVEYAQHKIHGNRRGKNQDMLVAQRVLEGGRRTLKGALNVLRHSQFVPDLFTASMASPSEAFGARLNESVMTGNWHWW
jgi:hypothetical protein